jgi:hypothetical protein
MKEVAIVLLVALALSGCGSTTTVQTPSTAIWAAVLTGGSGDAPDPDPSFNTQFTLNSDASLSITFLQFLTEQSCFPINGGTQTGQIANLNINSSTYAITGTLNYTVQSGNNTLTLTGPLTGTELGTTLTNGLVANGTWIETSSDPGSKCAASGSFTMTQCISGSCTPIP